MSPEEIVKDILDLRELVELAKRTRNKNLLLSQIARLEKELKAVADGPVPIRLDDTADEPKEKTEEGGKSGKKGKKKKSAPAPDTPTPAPTQEPPKKEQPLLPLVRLTNYAFDQSIKFAKIYVNFDKATEIPPEKIKVDIKPSSVELFIENYDGKNYLYKVEDLIRDIDPAESKHKVKEDSILLLLKKQKEGEEWDAVTKVEHFNKAKYGMKQPDVPQNLGPQAGMMKMMGEMYRKGDDDMKRTIKKAMWEAQKDRYKKS